MPSLPPPTAPGTMRIHPFAGDFTSKDAAVHYCFGDGTDTVTGLVRDLPGASLDTDHVEVRFREAETRLGEFLLPTDAARIMQQMGPANTLVIIAEPAFGGLAYALNDTPRLRYLGPLVVRV